MTATAAAAIKGRADLIVTANLKDFPAEKVECNWLLHGMGEVQGEEPKQGF